MSGLAGSLAGIGALLQGDQTNGSRHRHHGPPARHGGMSDGT